ncbi:hypothetical protein NL676_016666 [Syzygium grande]|nr:hypothetical protein NL676_016666 [Syzygium grande]
MWKNLTTKAGRKWRAGPTARVEKRSAVTITRLEKSGKRMFSRFFFLLLSLLLCPAPTAAGEQMGRCRRCGDDESPVGGEKGSPHEGGVR